jgi:hypothetical protein
MALLLLVGVRPAEFERGVRVSHSVDDDGVQLTVTVQGRKCKSNALTPPMKHGVRAIVSTGQERRSLTFRPASLWAMHLATFIEGQGGEDLVVTEKAKPICDAFRRFAKIAFKGRKGRLPSAYDCRHDCAAEWKVDQGAEGVALALGHSSLATQQRYGNRRSKGRRPDHLLRVDASAQPRATTKVRPMPAATIAGLRNRGRTSSEMGKAQETSATPPATTASKAPSAPAASPASATAPAQSGAPHSSRLAMEPRNRTRP